MRVIGIVAEYNPFHTGHQYQISESRRAVGGEAGVVAVMSGNWVQQAGCAITDKWNRARLALMGGVDLVLELPTVWAVSSAESFAQGAVDLLEATGVVDVHLLRQRVRRCGPAPTGGRVSQQSGIRDGSTPFRGRGDAIRLLPAGNGAEHPWAR